MQLVKAALGLLRDGPAEALPSQGIGDVGGRDAKTALVLGRSGALAMDSLVLSTLRG
jgi:hypothetical protein